MNTVSTRIRDGVLRLEGDFNFEKVITVELTLANEGTHRMLLFAKEK